jgi:hypothetical protein
MRHAGKRVGCEALPSGSEIRVPNCGRSSPLNSETPQAELPLTDTVHQFNADRDRRVVELLEPQHGSDTVLDPRWSGSIRSLRYFDDRSLISVGRWDAA